MKEICHNCEIGAELSFYKFLAKEKRLQLKKQVRGERESEGEGREREKEGLWHPQNRGGLNPSIDSKKTFSISSKKFRPLNSPRYTTIVTYSFIS